MSTHIAAKPGDIAERVLLPGDPLRAKHIAEKFLDDVACYSTTRNMLGFTGTHNGRRVSVQGSGMGMPSLGIYVNELLREYGVTEIIRVGTCGSLQANLGIGKIVVAQGSCSESNMNRRRFKGMDFAPIADWRLLETAVTRARDMELSVRVGNILAADMFYNHHAPDEWKMWAKYGVLAVEMETAELYTLAAEYGARALSILTVSDCLASQQPQMSSEKRVQSGDRLARLALSI